MKNKPPLWPIFLPAVLLALIPLTYAIEGFLAQSTSAPATSIYPQERPVK